MNGLFEPALGGASAAARAQETEFLAEPPAEVAADGTFEGYASLFGVPDLGKDVVVPGAFAASLARRGASGVRMLWQHDPAEPIGRWLTLAEDSRGLRVRGRLNLAEPPAEVAADGTFEGYASLFGVPDLGKDVVVPGAFAASLARRGASGVRMLWQHDPAEPIGRWLTLAEDSRGLRVRGRLNLA